jgi:two-component system sensor histidine kinase YesM
MRKNRIRRNLKLNSRLTPIILVLIFFPIAVFSGVLFRNLEVSAIRESRDSMEARIERESEQIETNIESINMSTRFFLSDEELQEVLNRAADGDAIPVEELVAFYSEKIADLERLVNNNPMMYAVRVYSVTDEVQEMMPILYTGSRMKNLSWYGDEMEGWKFGYSDTLFPSLTANQKTYLVSLVTAVTDYDRGVTGYIESAMTMETMFSGFYEEGEDEWSFFTDADGNVLFGETDPEKTLSVMEVFGDLEPGQNCQIRYRKIGNRYCTVGRYPVRAMKGVVYSVKDISSEIRGVYHRRNLFVVIMIGVLVVTAILIDRMVRRYQKEVLDKNAELRSLHNQINAHFIYNVLESIKMMAEIDEKYEISDAITSLGKLMRYSIRSNFENVTLAEELEYIRNYVLLMNLWYDFEVILSINVPEELMKQEILKMSLQPVVENAVIHGIEPVASDTTVYIKAWEEAGTFTVEITDSGKGMDAEELEKLRHRIHGEIEESGGSGNGVGLKNVEDRINLTFGSGYGMEVYSEPLKYTKVAIRLPRQDLGRKSTVNADTTDRGR